MIILARRTSVLVKLLAGLLIAIMLMVIHLQFWSHLTRSSSHFGSDEGNPMCGHCNDMIATQCVCLSDGDDYNVVQGIVNR